VFVTDDDGRDTVKLIGDVYWQARVMLWRVGCYSWVMVMWIGLLVHEAYTTNSSI